eukprot:3933953-Rhodomonas_salina.1
MPQPLIEGGRYKNSRSHFQDTNNFVPALFPPNRGQPSILAVIGCWKAKFAACPSYQVPRLKIAGDAAFNFEHQLPELDKIGDCSEEQSFEELLSEAFAIMEHSYAALDKDGAGMIFFRSL